MYIKGYFNREIIGPKLLVVDELAYLPFRREEANLFFNLVAKRYERGSVILTSNLSFTQWAGALEPTIRRSPQPFWADYITRTSCRSPARAIG